MFIIDDETGDMFVTQGDSGQYPVGNIPSGKNLVLYLAIQNKNRKPIGSEMSVHTGGHSTASIDISKTLTDLLTVPSNKETEEYYFGIKGVDPETGYEETYVIGNKGFGDLNTITVYPKKVEGE